MGRRAEDRFDIVRCIDDRYDIIDLLRSGRHDKPSIVDALGTSRSTVDRAMARLEDHHLVRRQDTGYDLTYQGRGLLAWYDSSLTMLGPIGEHGAVLSELPSDLGLPIESLGSMEFHEADRYEPGLPQRRFLELLEESDRFRGIAPATNEQLIDTLHRRVAIEGRHAEVVTERAIVKYLLETYPRTCRDVLAAESCTLLAYDGRLEFGMSLLGREPAVTIGAFDRDNHLQGMVVSEGDPEVRSWAEATYQEYRETAEPVDAGDVASR